MFFSDGRGGSTGIDIQGDLGVGRTDMAAAAAGATGMTAHNVGLGLWREQGGRLEYVPERQE